VDTIYIRSIKYIYLIISQSHPAVMEPGSVSLSRGRGSTPHLVVIRHDGAPYLTGVDPGDIVLHISGDQVSRVGDHVRTDADVALFDESDGLVGGA